MDPDGGVHANRLRAQKEKETTSTIPIPLPSEGWMSNLCQLPPFNYSCLYAHLVMGSPTIPKNQISAADTSYRAGAMKQKEAGYRLFRDNHVMMVRFNSSLDNYCLFHAYVKPSFKCTGKYSTVVSLEKHSGHVVGGKCNCKAGAGACCKHVAALLYNILDYTELGLDEIPQDKTCTEQPQQWHKPKTNADNGPALFSEIQFVHHAYRKRKAEECALRMEKWNKFRACPSKFSTLIKDCIRQFCTSLEANNNAVQFTAVMRNNDCKPLSSPACSSTSPACSSTSDNNSTLDGDSAIPAPTPEEKVWKKVNVNSEQAEHIEKITRAQADSAE